MFAWCATSRSEENDSRKMPSVMVYWLRADRSPTIVGVKSETLNFPFQKYQSRSKLTSQSQIAFRTSVCSFRNPAPM